MKTLTDRSELEVQSKGDPTVKDISVEEGEEPSTSLGRVNGDGHMIHEVSKDESIGVVTVVTPESERTKADHDKVEVDSGTAGPTSPTSKTHNMGNEVSHEPAQLVRASASVPIAILSSDSSSSAPENEPDLDEGSDEGSDDTSHQESDSLFDEQSESEQSNAVVYSGPASDLGLDGSIFSRPQPPTKVGPPPGVIQRPEGLGANSLNTDNAQDIVSPLQSDVEQTESEGEEPSVSDDSASESLLESLLSGDEASDEDFHMLENHDAAQRRSSVQIPSSDQLGSPEARDIDDQALKYPAAKKSFTNDTGTWKDVGQDESAVQRSPSNPPSPSSHFESPESQEELVLSSHEILRDEAALELISEKMPTDPPERKSPLFSRGKVDSSAVSDETVILETSADRDPVESTVRQESPITRQQEMVLGSRLPQEDSKTLPPQSQEVKDYAQNLGTRTSEIQQTTVEIIDLESSDEDDISLQTVGQKGFQVIVDENDSNFAPTHKVSTHGSPLLLASFVENEHQISIDEARRLSTRPDSAGLVLRPTTAVEEFLPADIHVAPEVHEEALALEQEHSHTRSPVARSKGDREESPSIEEAPLVRFEAKLETQESQFPSQEKDCPKQLVTVESELKPIPTDELPSTVPDSIEETKLRSQLLTPISTQQTNFVSQSSSLLSLHSAPKGDTLPTPRLTQGTSDGIVPLQSLAPPKEPTLTETPAPPKKTSALIEKLKEMRRLSSQSPKPRSSDASILDPWFAPRRISQVVPDSEDGSEAESSPEREVQASISKVIGGQLPQTPEKPLAKCFIRSPSQPKHISSIQSSPQYLPPSQPPPPGFRTTLSYFVPLATLPSHFATIVDVLVIALSSTPVTRATSGPRDYNQSLYITDPSSLAMQHPLTTAQIFRPNNHCFPLVEKGGALLLRNFKVQPFEKRLLLLSTESSAWAVFCKGTDVQIRGPPVEYGAEERAFARGLWHWWASLGDDARKRLDDAVPEYKKPNGSGKTTKTKAGASKSDVPIKTEEIEGLGVDLPGSQSKRRESLKERSLAFDGVNESDVVCESIEAPKRVLRARGAKGAIGRSESARESRFGTVFTGGLGEPDETQGSAHELRDGKAYRANGR